MVIDSIKDEIPLWKTLLWIDELEQDFWDNQLDIFEMLVKKRKKKKKRIEDEEMSSYYNVVIYQMLPYPPGTRDIKDSYVQRT